MPKKKKAVKPCYGIIGLGRFGGGLMRELAASGAELLVLDCDEEKVRDAREFTENAIVVSSLDRKTLEKAGIQSCDVVVLCMAGEIDVSILTVLNLVSLGIKTVIAKASSAEHGEVLSRLGARVVYPERDMAVRLAHQLQSSGTLDFVQLSGKVNVAKQAVPKKMIGKTVLELNLRARFGLNVVAVENNGDVDANIGPSYTFCENDIFFAVGDSDGLERLVEWSNSQ